MHMTKLCSKYLQNRNEENKGKYTKQTNYRHVQHKNKKAYYSNLDM